MSIFWKNEEPTGFFYVTLVGAVLGLIFAILAGVMMFFGWFNNSYMPSRRLARATVEKRIQVEDAIAKRDSAVRLAEAEVERAKGVAEANEIIADSIDEAYLRYLFVTGISDQNNEQIIYVPTEANLPILEAGKRPLP